jgi:predicted DNA-binding antitoxin AbrB/MazE fold protein
MSETKMKPAPRRNVTEKRPDHPDFAVVIELMANASEAAARLAEIEAEANKALVELVSEFREEYAENFRAQGDAESAMELLARQHPEWFNDAKSIKTPFGKIAFREGAALKVENDEATVKLLRALEPKINARLKPGEVPWIAEDYIRTVEVPNLEALEKLPDDSLELFMVKREVKDVFSFTPAKVDFGKAVKGKLLAEPPADAEKN